MKIEEVKQAYSDKRPMTVTITITDIVPRIRRLEKMIEEFFETQIIGDAVRAGDYAGHLISDGLESGTLNYQVDWARLSRKEE